MKFGRRLQEESFEEFEPHYIAYKELKKAIKLITGSDTSQFTISEVTNNFGNIPALAGSTYRPAESRFQDLLNFEVDKINKFSALIYSSISSGLQAALKNLHNGEITTLEALDSLRDTAETSADGVAYLHSYVRLNFVGFRKITKKYDKHNKSAASGFYLARLVKEPFINMNFDFLIELISICFGEMRRVKRVLLARHEMAITEPTEAEVEEYEEDDISLDDDNRRDNSDVTNTTYLVGEADLMRVRVHLAKHIPLTSTGSIDCPKPSRAIVKAFVSGIPEHHQHGSRLVTVEGPGTKELPKCARVNTNLMLDSSGNFSNPAIYRFEQNRVSAGCLYLDNSKLKIYRQLLSPQVDESMAEILRLRWDPNVNSSRSVILEIVKAFQAAESPNEWHDVPLNNAEGNVPNAIALKRTQIPDFLNGALSVDSILADLNLPTSRTAEVKSLLQRAANVIGEQECRPVFQEWIHRSHFRKTGPNVNRRIFAHLDENVRFTDVLKHIQSDPSFSNFWTPPHLGPFLTDSDVHSCPFGVLSISLAGKPKFLPKITGLITVSEVWRYAPHLHGVSVFHRTELGSSDVPHWFQFVTSDVDDNKNKAKKVTKADDVKGTDGNSVVRVDVVSSKPGSRLLHEHAATLQQQQQQQDISSVDDRRLSNNVTTQTKAGRSSRAFSGLNEPLLSHVGLPITESSDAPYHALPSHSHHTASNARTPFLIGSEQQPEEGLLIRCFSCMTSMLPSFPQWLSISGDSQRSALVGSAAVRVEPKTFFANERTLLQWMNTAVLLSTISITLLNFGTSTGRLAGLIMAPVALFFIIYSFLVYLRRSYSLERKEPINYNDRLGPAILVLSLISALSAIIILNIIYGPANELTTTAHRDSPVIDAANRASGANIDMPHPPADFLAQTHSSL